MKDKLVKIYRCPNTKQKLSLENAVIKNDDVISGELRSSSGAVYPIVDGLPDFTYPKRLLPSDSMMREYYENVADVYDDLLPLTFSTFGVNEWEERGKLINASNIKEDSIVLDMGCGSGRDSKLIAEKLGKNGQLFSQDLSVSFLKKAIEPLSEQNCDINLAVSNGSYLPFSDNFFDCAFHFGGLNTFDDIGRALSEMVRVTKVGGKVVVGDENMPIWLRDTEFGKVLMNSNPHYEYDLPLKHMPVEARDVNLSWIMGGVFYYIDFVVGAGEPYADIDFEIPGARGGTHRTRYYGHLEGISPEAKESALKAAASSGKSMYEWLNDAVLAACRADE